jgi:hypothetical protein
MHSKRESVEEFRRLIEKGSIQTAYRALLSYMMALRIHFQKRLGASAVSGLYQGYMDMTYFALFPPSLRRRNLKIAYRLQLRRVSIRSLAFRAQPESLAAILGTVQRHPMARSPCCRAGEGR